MAEYFGKTKATKVYPKQIDKASVGIELDFNQALEAMSSIVAYLNSKESATKRLIITAHKARANKNGEVPMTFIAGKN